jgi:hypothetical protein
VAGVDDDGVNGVDDHGELCPLDAAGIPRPIPGSDDKCAEWTQKRKIIAPDAEPVDSFGGSVAVSGDTVVVGAERDDDGGESAGSAYLIEL